MSHGFARHGLAVTHRRVLVGRGCALGLVGAHHTDISRTEDRRPSRRPARQQLGRLHALRCVHGRLGRRDHRDFAAGVTAYLQPRMVVLRRVDFDDPWISAGDHHDHPQSGHNITSWDFLVKH